jgi:hypothetical protein
MKLYKNIRAGLLLTKSLGFIDPEKEYNGKRVAIVGAAETAFQQKMGEFIDGHDIVIRVNKAPYAWNSTKAEFIGSKFTHLYHSFYENNYSGGGPIDWALYDRIGVQKLINPLTSRKGLLAHFNYYKRQEVDRKTYMLKAKSYKKISYRLNGYVPTIGFCALMTVLQSDFKSLYITGFTFFQSTYAAGYRDHFLNKKNNLQHIKDQGLHLPLKELEIFKNAVADAEIKKKIILDSGLKEVLKKAGKGMS